MIGFCIMRLPALVIRPQLQSYRLCHVSLTGVRGVVFSMFFKIGGLILLFNKFYDKCKVHMNLFSSGSLLGWDSGQILFLLPFPCPLCSYFGLLRFLHDPYPVCKQADKHFVLFNPQFSDSLLMISSPHEMEISIVSFCFGWRSPFYLRDVRNA